MNKLVQRIEVLLLLTNKQYKPNNSKKLKTAELLIDWLWLSQFGVICLLLVLLARTPNKLKRRRLSYSWRHESSSIQVGLQCRYYVYIHHWPSFVLSVFGQNHVARSLIWGNCCGLISTVQHRPLNQGRGRRLWCIYSPKCIKMNRYFPYQNEGFCS